MTSAIRPAPRRGVGWRQQRSTSGRFPGGESDGASKGAHPAGSPEGSRMAQLKEHRLPGGESDGSEGAPAGLACVFAAAGVRPRSTAPSVRVSTT